MIEGSEPIEAAPTMRARGVHYLILHPTAQARPIYETMNWQATSEMSLRLS